MRAVAKAFLDSLYDGQRHAATYDFTDAERKRWQYTPGPRAGLALEDMQEPQRELAMALIEAGLSQHGAETSRAIMELEPVLKALEEGSRRPGSDRRNAEHYWFSIFGDPASDEPWAWRVGGHHLCLHFTVVGNETSETPLFFGANPARIPSGERQGVRVLGDEEDLARAFVAGLDDAQRDEAVVAAEAPSDILTGNAVRAEITAVPTGLDCRSLDEPQLASMSALLDVYLRRVRRPPRVELGSLWFAWAGSTRVGEGHYYAIRGDSLLIEYDNTQNNANHVHTVWRDVRRDWGEDLLRRHYEAAH